MLYSRSLLSIKESSIHILISNSPIIPLSPFYFGKYNFCFYEEKGIYTFWMRVCACESGVARESKPERDSFEMMVSLRQKLQNGLPINFLLHNYFEHNKYKKEECHEPYISPFSISNYKTKLLVQQIVID